MRGARVAAALLWGVTCCVACGAAAPQSTLPAPQDVVDDAAPPGDGLAADVPRVSGASPLAAEDTDGRAASAVEAPSDVAVDDDDVGAAAADGASLLPDTPTLHAARRDAVLFLRGAQRSDGSWGGRPGATTARDRAWSQAVTALCVQALLPTVLRGSDDAATSSFRAGLAALLEQCAQPPVTTDAVWGDAYALSASCAVLDAAWRRETDLGVDLVAVERTSLLLVDRLTARRGADGSWGASDQLGREEPALDEGRHRPFVLRTGQSHVTAVVVLALDAAEALGLPGTLAALQSGRAALRRSRQVSGVFTHRIALLPGPGHRFGADELPASLGRRVAGTLALLDSVPYGSSRRDVLAALETFFQEHAALDLVLRRGDTTPSGLSAYVYLFGHYYAARALEALLPAERALYDRRLAREILVVRRQDGAFLDHPLGGLGPVVGTAFALLSLEHILRE